MPICLCAVEPGNHCKLADIPCTIIPNYYAKHHEKHVFLGMFTTPGPTAHPSVAVTGFGLKGLRV